MNGFDVYAYGVVASSTLLHLRGSFPHSNGYGEIKRAYAVTGGEAANSSIVLSRLGLRVMLDGTWMGDTPGGKAALAVLKKSGVNTSSLRRLKKNRGLWEMVISDGPTRTVFGNYGEGLKTRVWNAPSRALMAQARIVCLDPALGRESIEAGRMARHLGVPYVTIDRPYIDPLGRSAAALILSHDFLGWRYPRIHPGALLPRYCRKSQGLVILTSGGGPILYGRKGTPVRTLRPFRVKVVDTTSAGDAFRAGVIFGLLKGWPDLEVVRYGAAVAALVCTTVPSAVHSPRHADVVAFLRI